MPLSLGLKSISFQVREKSQLGCLEKDIAVVRDSEDEFPFLLKFYCKS